MHVKIFQRGFCGWRWIYWPTVTLVWDPPLWLKMCTPYWGRESFWLTQITQRNSKPLPALSIPLEKVDFSYSVHLSMALVPWRWYTKWSHHWVLHYGESGWPSHWLLWLKWAPTTLKCKLLSRASPLLQGVKWHNKLFSWVTTFSMDFFCNNG